jgi:hypothetical protein
MSAISLLFEHAQFSEAAYANFSGIAGLGDNRLAVPVLTRRHTFNADVDTWARLPIPQASEPILEYRRFANFEHFLLVLHGLLFCKLVLGWQK